MFSIFNGLLCFMGGWHRLFFVTGESSEAAAVDPNATFRECGVRQDVHIELNKFIFISADGAEV